MIRCVVCRYVQAMYVRMDLLQPLPVIRRYSICSLFSIDFTAKPRRHNFIVRSANRKDSASNSDESNTNKGENLSTDWDKAWSNFRKQKKKKKLFSNFDIEKYVTRNPRPSDYPLSEEIDPLRKTERSVLDAWTNPKFTVVGFSIVVGLLIFYIALK
ncbi:uncharacterized protein LOC131056149 [Cryptomeria japonica]|uniref:uncharacterized protein LOC131056149 n=1 Tax=Cryptomeria japonica TaxID=3369 RepID=UPI0025AB649B|nr:uncharacterized protein LOC131056149 [Cryptomeria japonica]